MFREICLSQERLFYKCVVDINLNAHVFNGDAAADARDGCRARLLCVCNEIPLTRKRVRNVAAAGIDDNDRFTAVAILHFKNYESGFTAPRCLCLSDMSHRYASGLDLKYTNKIER